MLKVISGGQVGADIAGLRAAEICGLPTGGWMPKGFRTQTGPLDPYLVGKYGLAEMPSRGYPQRTMQNVIASDATIRLAYDWYSPGEKLTQRFLNQYKKERWDVKLRPYPDDWSAVERWTILGLDDEQTHAFAELTADWIGSAGFGVLNVAGNANRSIEPLVESFLRDVFTVYKSRYM